MIISPATPRDLDEALSLNQSEVPHVGSIDAARMRHLYEQALYMPVARLQGALAGFVIVLDEKADYDSLNFRWFTERYTHFSYIDRVAVAGSSRRQGVARALYNACTDYLENEGHERLTLEYNTAPPNPVSAAFHAALGFEEVGRRRDLDTMSQGTFKEVSMQCLNLRKFV